jgi:hypothetical protein
VPLHSASGLFYFSILTAQILYSGVPVMGSRCSDVRKFKSASGKWKVMNTIEVVSDLPNYKAGKLANMH